MMMKRAVISVLIATFSLWRVFAQESFVPYIPEDQMPDVVQCVPAPPQDPSTEFDHDILRYMWGKQQRKDPARLDMAVRDAIWNMDTTLVILGESFGLTVSKTDTPAIYEVLTRGITTIENIRFKPKAHYFRIRPFAYFKEPSIFPQDDEWLATEGSYPSGHTIRAWACALLMAEINPACAEAVFGRAWLSGESRVISGCHWQSDVDASRPVASIGYSRLQTSGEFRAQMALAQDEFRRLARTDCQQGREHFVSLPEVVPAAPDYTDETLWITEDDDPEGTGADVFYVVSTWEEDWTDGKGHTIHYADVWNPTHREHMGTEMKGVAAYMAPGNRFYAPFYRHATIDAFLTRDDETIRERTRLSMEDICDAFDLFQRQRDQGRPLIIAGFSQGGMAVVELLKHMDDNAYSQLAAAYVLGFKVTDEDLASSSHIRPAESADDIGVTICYNTVKDVKYLNPVISSTSIAINPVNWTTDATPAILHDSITVTLSPEYHVLVVDGYEGKEYPAYADFINVGDIHSCEPWLYSECLQENMGLRARAWRAEQSPFEVYDLRCEGLVEPLAIDSAEPHFSWKIRCSEPMEQAAYQLEVEPGRWQSGKVCSSDQVMLPYSGKPLESRQLYRWRVRVWNQEGKASAWSPWQRFGVGPLDGMRGAFIGAVPGEGRASMLRKVFTVNKGGEALLYVASLGYHEVFLNGEKCPDAVLQPAVSQLNKRALICAYPLRLQAGENELRIDAGSGWYKQTTFGTAYDGPLVKAELDRDGEPLLWTDASWEGAWGGYRDLGTWKPHRFGGESIDAGAEPCWGPVDVIDVTGVEASPQMCAPVIVQETLYPQTIESLGGGRWMVDFGRIVNAMMDISLPELPAGTEVRATFSDFRHPDGRLEEATEGQDIYISAGKAHRFRNSFNHHLMRYMLLEGLPKAPRKDDIRALRIGDDLVWEGSFSSSDPELNAIFGLVEASLQNLTFGGYMVDCASIERLGYGGDGNASTRTLQAMAADTGPLYLNWLQAWADAQQPKGGLPHTAPNPYTAGGGPYWCSFLVQAAWKTYMSSGDRRPLERFYPAMKHWLDYVDAYTVDGLLKTWPNESYRGWYLGDWAAPAGVDVNDPASVDLVNNCALCQVYACLEQIASVLGKDGAPFRARREALARRIQEVFYQDGLYASGSQIDQVFPLLTGVTPAEEMDKVVKVLKDRTDHVYGGHLATGLVGVPVLTEWAARAGECEWMYGLLKQKDYPGYLYMLENGATGVWEEWDGGRSHLHNCYNGVGAWFFEALGGIVPLEPGYRRVLIDPQVPAGLEWVRVEQPTPYGTIVVHRKGDQLEVTLPVGVSAILGEDWR